MPSDTIRFCDPAQDKADPESIRFCDAAQDKADPEAIQFCAIDGAPEAGSNCDDPPELFIAGSDEPAVGNFYSAAGGVPPYTWTFAGGTISDEGEILSLTSCGGPDNGGAVGHVTVTDDCGQSASIEVRLPGGHWSTISTVNVATGTHAGYCDEVSGGSRTAYSVASNLPNPSYYSSCAEASAYNSGCGHGPIDRDGPLSPNLTGLGCDDIYPGTSRFMCLRLLKIYHDEWIC